MPTTLVKSVKLDLTTSKIAQTIHVFVLLFVIWAILVSYMPLVLSGWMIFYGLNVFLSINRKTALRRVSITSEGCIFYQGVLQEIKYCHRLYKPWLTVVTTKSHFRVLIWVDSVKNSDYRQLNLLLDEIEKQKKSDNILPL